jgi:hypothetical protein
MIYTVNEQNAKQIYDWIKSRGGILIWNSVNLSNPSASVTTPYLTNDGKVFQKPSWEYDKPTKHITSFDDVQVSIPKEYKRFKVGVENHGLSFKLTSTASRRLEQELEKAEEKLGKSVYYEFDYWSDKNCVIMYDDTVIPLTEFIETKE